MEMKKPTGNKSAFHQIKNQFYIAQFIDFRIILLKKETN